MKVQRFVDVLEKFCNRALIFFPEDGFEERVSKHIKDVLRALYLQLDLPEETKSCALPRDEEMKQESVRAFEKLCDLLDQEDPEVGYYEITGFAASQTFP